MIRHYLRKTFILLLVFGLTIFMLPVGVFAQSEVYVDIKPGSCPNPINVKSQGVVTVAILGTADLDVTTIDPASIRLLYGETEVAPIRSSIEDVAAPFIGDILSCEDCYMSGPDGYADLTVKFRTQDIVAALEGDIIGGTITDGQCVVLTFEGILYDTDDDDTNNPTITGQDVVQILIKGKTPVRNRKGHLNQHRHFPTE